ncbi:hypothetical protein SpCBS45565_g01706 [Spizellomyces sp. 'palustris']|nr:hypothetical protein SpCBS45565_g01706 [Spizellomyces sp. 'palustris']
MEGSVTVAKTSDKEYLYHTVNIPPYRLTIASRLEDTDSDDDFVDPYLFDPSYTLAAATGFSVWEGSVALLSFIHSAQSSEAQEFRRRVLEKREKVVELGSGTGIGGLGVAALGGDVLCTDVESVCDLTRSNVRRNSLEISSERWEGGWNNSVSVGRGTAGVQPLDWSQPVFAQRKPNDPTSASIIIAAETAWLADLAPLFVETVANLLRSGVEESTCKVCYWAYKERGTEASKIFTTMTNVKRAFHQAGCEVVEIWRECSKEDPDKHVIINTIHHARQP